MRHGCRGAVPDRVLTSSTVDTYHRQASVGEAAAANCIPRRFAQSDDSARIVAVALDLPDTRVRGRNPDRLGLEDSL